MDDREQKREGTALEGKTFVLTGTLHSLTRRQARELLEQQGARVSSSVSSKTDYLVAGEAAGSKLERALQLGVEVLDEPSLEALLGGSGRSALLKKGIT